MGADCFYDINTEKHTASRLRKPSRIVALRNNAAIYICAPLTLAKGVRNIYTRLRYLFGLLPCRLSFALAQKQCDVCFEMLFEQ